MHDDTLIQITAGDFFVRDLRKHTPAKTETAIKEALGSQIWKANQRMRGNFTEDKPLTIWHGTGGGSSFKWSLLVEVGGPSGGHWRKSVLKQEILRIISMMTEGAFQPDHLIVRFV